MIYCCILSFFFNIKVVICLFVFDYSLVVICTHSNSSSSSSIVHYFSSNTQKEIESSHEHTMQTIQSSYLFYYQHVFIDISKTLQRQLTVLFPIQTFVVDFWAFFLIFLSSVQERYCASTTISV